MLNGILKLKSTSAMLMHSDRLANPLDPITEEHKKLTKVRTKTKEMHWAIAKSQWMAALYLNDDNRIIMPGANIRACLIDGAKFRKKGMDVKRAVIIAADHCILEYDGPKNPEKLWENKKFRDMRTVVVSRSKVIACRPRFMEWSCEIPIVYDETIIDTSELEMAIASAGQLCGVGTYRPLFGRFDGELIHE